MGSPDPIEPPADAQVMGGPDPDPAPADAYVMGRFDRPEDSDEPTDP